MVGVDNSLDSLADSFLVEIDQEAQAAVGDLEVSEKLSFEDWVKLHDRFDFDHESAVDDENKATRPHHLIIVHYLYLRLRNKRDGTFGEFDAKRIAVVRLRQSRSELVVNGKHCLDNPTRQRIQFRIGFRKVIQHVWPVFVNILPPILLAIWLFGVRII